ncbi:MAG: hypothetical protein Q7S30_05280 [Candidatus Omnitrophota bacterium]|nr:hypothetical protein [Candidatus Omnitrophota bacterium]
MRTVLFVCVALLIILTSIIPARCQSDSLVDNIKTIDGNVVSVDNQSSQIAVKSSEVMNFSVPAGSKIVNADGYAIQLSDVSAGNYVTIDYRDDKSGNHVLSGMEVEYNR